jgi:hypothetical protein
MLRATTSRIKNTNGRTFAMQAASPSIPPNPSTAATTATTTEIKGRCNICAFRDVLHVEPVILERAW